ncbi:MAG: hypothetical protein QOD29_6502, partial [Alphaproteobacteria bacterium]|nr:hypothetical protein [Alphaproteobacteria bacterium]
GQGQPGPECLIRSPGRAGDEGLLHVVSVLHLLVGDVQSPQGIAALKED